MILDKFLDFVKTNLHNTLFSNKKCYKHQDNDFEFYCFTCKQYICTLCFKEHQNHEIEIKDDLDDISAFMNTLPNKEEINQKLINYKNHLQEMQSEITKEIESIESKLSNIPTQISNKFITDLSYKEFEDISYIYNIHSQIESFNTTIKNISDKFTDQRYANFRWMSNEISVTDASIYKINNKPEIILGKISGDYYLSDGNRNHYIVFDFGKNLFIKRVKISV